MDFDEGLRYVDVPFKEKIKRASSSAVNTFKDVFWYLLLGAGIGAFIYGFVPQGIVIKVAGSGNSWSIPIASVIDVPYVYPGRNHNPYRSSVCEKRHGLRDGCRPDYRRCRGKYPGVDHTWLHVQKETGPCIRGERISRCHYRWILDRLAGILR